MSDAGNIIGLIFTVSFLVLPSAAIIFCCVARTIKEIWRDQ